MTEYERLSRLLDGDLPDAERRELEAVIERDPALQRQWAAMQAVAEALDALPEPVPAALDAAVLGSAASPPSRLPGWLSPATVAPWGLAAAAALALFALAPDPGLVRLVEGTQRIEGEVHALAGTVPVDVDGVAVITVEPDPEVLRVMRSKEDPMPKTAILSALAGAAVTVAVYEGTALVGSPDGGPPIEVRAGETHSIGPRRVKRVVAGPDAAPPPADEAPAATIARLQAENDALREALHTSQFEGAVAKGQLEAHQGAPIPWPDKVPAGMEPDAFEAGLRKVLETHPDMELLSLDCGEFPCVAVLTGPAGDEGWQQRMQQVPKDFVAAQFGEDDPIGMQVMMAATDDNGAQTGAVGFAVTPEGPDTPQDPGLDTRTGYRTRSLLEGFVDP
ncbi:MAG: hypothetical protein H6737_02815 [Alphaproteobacteria bacterium]|nr:hypothetical protein [Alphaproteobacteria bacterium]